MPDPAPFDHSRAAAFEERLVGVLNAGALCLMTSLGHRVGLFDVMADMPAASSEANRRKMIRDYYAAGKFDELRNELLRDRWDT